MDWIRMDQYRTGCWVFMKLAMNLRVQLETVNLLTGKETVSFSRNTASFSWFVSSLLYAEYTVK